MTGTLTVGGLTRRFPGADVATLDGVDLEVPTGGCVALLGPSGSGKSTVLRLVARLDVPEAGDVLVDGRSQKGIPLERRRTVLAFQRPRLFPHLDVLDNVAFPLLVAGARRRAARADAGRFLDLVRLGTLARRRPRSLSGGQEQRVALARALAARPDVLLLDEPFSALDPKVRAEMHELLAELRAAVEPTVLLVTHDRHEAAVVADTVAVLLDGRIAQHAPVAELYTRPRSLAVHALLGGRNAVPGEVVDGVHRSALGDVALAGTELVETAREDAAPAGVASWDVAPGETDVRGSIHSSGRPATHAGAAVPAALVVRQEAIVLVPPRDPTADLVATVVSVAAQGPRALVVVEAGGLRLEVEVPPGSTLLTGEPVGVVLPSYRHVVPIPYGRSAVLT